MTKVYAPNRQYKGITAGVQFRDGAGETDDPAALTYLRRAGYGIDEPRFGPAVLDATSAPSVDARDVAEPTTLGTPLRDAAVDPRARDFLPPTNAGLADPHGPLVVSPQIHGSETGAIVAGDVHVDDPSLQEAKETAVDTDVFVEGQTVDATASIDQPAASATKAEWVEFAVGQGIAREEAEDLTKAELQDRLRKESDS